MRKDSENKNKLNMSSIKKGSAIFEIVDIRASSSFNAKQQSSFEQSRNMAKSLRGPKLSY